MGATSPPMPYRELARSWYPRAALGAPIQGRRPFQSRAREGTVGRLSARPAGAEPTAIALSMTRKSRQ